MLHFAISIAVAQIKAGRHFLFEHPASASSWQDPWVVSLSKMPGVTKVIADQCMFGLTAKAPNEEEKLARKPTGFLTSSYCMANRLGVRCDGSHEHTALHGKQLEAAAFYPVRLRLAILRGMRDTADANAPSEYDAEIERATLAAGKSVSSLVNSVECQVRAQHKAQSEPAIKAFFRFKAGGRVETDLAKNMKERYLDEYTREELPVGLLRAAMHDEIVWLNNHVWEGVPEDTARAEPDAVIVGTRWVNCNKGDALTPDIRARLVAQEVNHSPEDGYFAATPPLECKRALISQMVTERSRNGANLKLSFVDVRKAYFNGRPTRNIYVRLPKEMGLPRTMLGKLTRCLYGTRDAGHIWEAVYGDALVKMGFTQGVASPCCFYHPKWEVSLVVHGDDFTALGTTKGVENFEEGMQKAFEVKLRGRLGPDKTDEKEMRVLNRILRMTKSGVAYEADPRHVELLVRSLSLQDGKSVATPGIKLKDEDVEFTDQEHTVASILADGNKRKISEREDARMIRFSDEVEVESIPGYSRDYGINPRTFEIFADSRGRLHRKRLGHNQDPFTGQVKSEMQRRLQQNQLKHKAADAFNRRAQVLEKTLIEGSAWESDSAMMIAAVSKKRKFKQKRLGAKAVKAIELEAKAGGVLVGAAATGVPSLKCQDELPCQ